MFRKTYLLTLIVFSLLSACTPTVPESTTPIITPAIQPILDTVTPVVITSNERETPIPLPLQHQLPITRTVTTVLPSFTSAPTVTPSPTAICREPELVSLEYLLPYEGNILYASRDLWAIASDMGKGYMLYPGVFTGLWQNEAWIAVDDFYQDSESYWVHNLLTGETKLLPRGEGWRGIWSDTEYEGIPIRQNYEEIESVGINRDFIIVDPVTLASQTIIEQIHLPDFYIATNSGGYDPYNYFAVKDPMGQLIIYTAFDGQEGFYLALRNILTDQEVARIRYLSRQPAKPYWLPDGSKVIIALPGTPADPVAEIISLRRDGQAPETIGSFYDSSVPGMPEKIEASADMKYISLIEQTQATTIENPGGEYTISILDIQTQTRFALCGANVEYSRWLDGTHLLVYVESVEDEEILQLLDVDSWRNRTLDVLPVEQVPLWITGWIPIEEVK